MPGKYPRNEGNPMTRREQAHAFFAHESCKLNIDQEQLEAFTAITALVLAIMDGELRWDNENKVCVKQGKPRQLH